MPTSSDFCEPLMPGDLALLLVLRGARLLLPEDLPLLRPRVDELALT